MHYIATAVPSLHSYMSLPSLPFILEQLLCIKCIKIYILIITKYNYNYYYRKIRMLLTHSSTK